MAARTRARGLLTRCTAKEFMLLVTARKSTLVPGSLVCAKAKAFCPMLSEPTKANGAMTRYVCAYYVVGGCCEITELLFAARLYRNMEWASTSTPPVISRMRVRGKPMCAMAKVRSCTAPRHRSKSFGAMARWRCRRRWCSPRHCQQSRRSALVNSHCDSLGLGGIGWLTLCVQTNPMKRGTLLPSCPATYGR
jgi:hypothetical protein